MATTEAIFNLKVNTGNSVEEIENTQKALEDLANATNEAEGGAFKLNAKFDDIYKDVQPLTTRLGELEDRMYELALAGQANSDEFKALQAEAVKFRRTIQDVDANVDNLAQRNNSLKTGLEALTFGANVFTGIQSAIALTGVENEKLVETMVKLQAVQGVTNSINAVAEQLNRQNILGIKLRIGLEKAKNFVLTGSIAGTTALAGAEAGLTTATTASTVAMKAFRLALIATGIGAIVVAIGLLISNFDKVTKVVKDAYNRFNELGKGIKIALAVIFPFIGAIYGVVKALQYMGVIDTDVNAKMKANAEERSKMTEKEMNAKIKAEQRKKNAVEDTMGFEIQLAKASGKETTKMERDKLKASLDAGRGILAMQKEKMNSYKAELSLLQQLGDGDSKRAKDLKKLIGETNKALSEQYKENVSNSRAIRILDAEQTAKRREEAKKRADERKAEREKYFAHLKELDDILKEALELEEKRRIDFANFLKTQNDELLAESERRYLEQLKREEEAEQRSLDLQKAYRRLIQSELENELEDLRTNFQEKENTINLAWANRMISDEERNNQLLLLQEQQAKAEIDIEKRKQKELKEEQEKAFAERVAGIERVIDYTQQLSNATASINQFMNASDNERLKQAKGNEFEEEKIKRRIFERDKKLRMAQVAIDTASNVITSIKNNGGIPYGLPAGAIALTAGAFQLAAISKATFDGNGGVQSASPQQLSAPVQSQQTNTAELPETEQPQAQQTVKVVVLENDITNIQNKVKVAENLSSF